MVTPAEAETPRSSPSWLHAEPEKVSRRALRLLLSLVLLILLHPLMGEGAWQRHVIGLLTFVPLILAVLGARRKGPLLLICLVSIALGVLFAVAGGITHNAMLIAAQWSVLTVAFGCVAAGLFFYLRRASQVVEGHLYIATSIYLLLAVLFYCLYSAATAINPHAFMQTATGPTRSPADLLYFSLITLTTLGYGDIVPVGGLVRMLAALEAVAGVMYVAITVATLVSGFNRPSDQT